MLFPHQTWARRMITSPNPTQPNTTQPIFGSTLKAQPVKTVERAIFLIYLFRLGLIVFRFVKNLTQVRAERGEEIHTIWRSQCFLS